MGKPWQLPLMQELKAVVTGQRVKRHRDGKFRNATGSLCALVIPATVRGQALQVYCDPRKILVNLTKSEDVLAWFIKELVTDFASSHADDPGDDQLVEATGRRPHELVEKTLRRLRDAVASPGLRSVCFDQTHNRFKVSIKGSSPQYTLVKGWGDFVRNGGKVSDLEVALEAASEEALEKCGCSAPLAPGSSDVAMAAIGDHSSDSELSATA